MSLVRNQEDRCDIDIEGLGEFADVLSRFFNKLASESALVRAQFGPTVEGVVGHSGGAPSFLGSYGNQRALELCDASEDGEHHAPGQRRRRPRVPQQIEVQRFFSSIVSAMRTHAGSRASCGRLHSTGLCQ